MLSRRLPASTRAAGRRIARAAGSWRPIAAEAWGTDILRERSFLLLVASRFFVLGGGAFLIALAPFRIWRGRSGLVERDERGLVLITAGRGLVHRAVVGDPGRAPVAACRTQEGHLRRAARSARSGMAIVARWRRPAAPRRRGDFVGVGGGSFLAVDWALMTDIIPKASSGRYMGISNVATATNGVVATVIGGLIIDASAGRDCPAAGPRVALPRGRSGWRRGAAAAAGRRATARGATPDAAGQPAPEPRRQPGAGRLSRVRASASQAPPGRPAAGRRTGRPCGRTTARAAHR